MRFSAAFRSASTVWDQELMLRILEIKNSSCWNKRLQNQEGSLLCPSRKTNQEGSVLRWGYNNCCLVSVSGERKSKGALKFVVLVSCCQFTICAKLLRFTISLNLFLLVKFNYSNRHCAIFCWGITKLNVNYRCSCHNS